MTIQTIDPLQDDRWVRFVDSHPSATVFHTREWLACLSRTYGYDVAGIVRTASSGEISSALPLCTVKSWLTGTRTISVPFADHCEPLGWSPADMATVRAELESLRERTGSKYVELRPIATDLLAPQPENELIPSASYRYHTLDLDKDVDTLFARLHVSCIQRKIRRAEASNLNYETGRSDEMLRRFYSLMVKTRRRHGLFPQPLAWFCNLASVFGEKLVIHLASKGQQPVAALITIQHQDKLVYKYGASDDSQHALGGMPFLFWRAILHGKSVGAKQFDLGRTDPEGVGLSTFKERLGAQSRNLNYYRFPITPEKSFLPSHARRVMTLATQLPDSVCSIAGRMLYRHAG